MMFPASLVNSRDRTQTPTRIAAPCAKSNAPSILNSLGSETRADRRPSSRLLRLCDGCGSSGPSKPSATLRQRVKPLAAIAEAADLLRPPDLQMKKISWSSLTRRPLRAALVSLSANCGSTCLQETSATPSGVTACRSSRDRATPTKLHSALVRTSTRTAAGSDFNRSHISSTARRRSRRRRSPRCRHTHATS